MVQYFRILGVKQEKINRVEALVSRGFIFTFQKKKKKKNPNRPAQPVPKTPKTHFLSSCVLANLPMEIVFPPIPPFLSQQHFSVPNPADNRANITIVFLSPKAVRVRISELAPAPISRHLQQLPAGT